MIIQVESGVSGLPSLSMLIYGASAEQDGSVLNKREASGKKQEVRSFSNHSADLTK